MIIKANGSEVHYELSGKKDGPVVMLSHSLGSSLVMWDPQLSVLDPRFRVLRYDTRGHGGSETPRGPYTLDMLGQDALQLLERLGIEKVHWVGLSMGGMIGQCIALHHPERLQSLALCDTSGAIPRESYPAIQERIETARKKGLKALLEPTMEHWFTPSFLKMNPAPLAFIRRQFLNTPVEGYVACSEAIRNHNCLDRLSALTLPTLIVVGEDDPGTPVAASKAMHERIVGSQLVILPSACHLSNIEQSVAFNRALLKFLQAR